MSAANLMLFANHSASNSIVDEVTNEVLIDLMNRHDFMSLLDQVVEDSSTKPFNSSNNSCTFHPQKPQECQMIQSTISSPSDMITLDESYIHQLIDLELRNVPSTLGLVWSKLSSTTNEFQFNARTITQSSTSSSPTTTTTTSACSNSNTLFNSFSSNNENQYSTTTTSPLLAGNNVWEPSSTPITSVPDSSNFVILPSLENSQQPDLHLQCNNSNGMKPFNGSLSYTGSPSKIAKKQKMKASSSPMKKQLVSNNEELSYCISFHQPESSFSNFTSYNDDKKVSKKRRSSSSSNNNMPNYRVRFSHNKFEEIEFKKSNPKGKFIIFK
ncbi:predicted protein [Naegleria gruberi]|uniref:Predicted protein n=1 Tax=Naegleria gruberi TaxID=5762 RepID=D2VGD2_NAEGR|nr:uncharacterized protein NAEGRDRAFT_67935 [Naegleria gruberi]EFC44046.1 predicted protein [Naegleria gruberi]|eukprot:XP_002676790.1 predicted protein [Naegleria gruberi strain NEG-M]